MANQTCDKLLVVACDLDGCCSWCPYFHDCNPKLAENNQEVFH